MKQLFLLFFALLTTNLTYPFNPVGIDQADAEKMAGALKNARTAADSIRILYDVYDLSDTSHKPEVGFRILDIATRTKDRALIISILNELASSTEDSGALSRLLQVSSSLPENADKKSVELVLQMEQARKSVPDNLDPADKEKATANLVRLDRASHDDVYQEILDLYKTMAYLGPYSQGPLYLTYITRFENLVNQLPDEDVAIKNLYYGTASIYYTRTRDYAKALESCRELLKIFQNMEKQFAENGRSHANLDYLYYVLYRRMLQNYRGLSREEVEDLYAKVQDLAKKNEEVREAYGKMGITDSYYFMATKQYDKALPAIEKALSHPDISKFRRQELTGQKAYASKALGHLDEEREALEEYVLMLVDERRRRIEDTYKELGIRNAVNHMTAQERAGYEQVTRENISMRKVAITLVYVLAVILIFICRSYFKLRHKVNMLESRNRSLHSDIEHIFYDGTPAGTVDLRKQRGRLKG